MGFDLFKTLGLKQLQQQAQGIGHQVEAQLRPYDTQIIEAAIISRVPGAAKYFANVGAGGATPQAVGSTFTLNSLLAGFVTPALLGPLPSLTAAGSDTGAAPSLTASSSSPGAIGGHSTNFLTSWILYAVLIIVAMIALAALLTQGDKQIG